MNLIVPIEHPDSASDYLVYATNKDLNESPKDNLEEVITSDSNSFGHILPSLQTFYDYA